MSDDIMTVGPLQLEILKEMWTQGIAMTVNEMHARINARYIREKRPILAYTTYLTVMRNLARRKLVSQSVVEGSRGHQFRPLISEREYKDRVLDHIKDSVYGGSESDFVTDATRRYESP